jgi:hypothetical protein
MPIVDRFFAQLQPEPEGSGSAPQPLSHYYSHPAVVVLGDPGSGKSTSFQQSAAIEENAVFVSIRDFLTLQADRWAGRTLYLDGLDEQRAKTEDGRGTLDRIRSKLDELKRPPYRLSCRAADWYGVSETERLRTVSPDGNVLVLRLEPLSDADIIAIAGDTLPDPADFLAQAQRRGIDPLLRNPQTLKLILAEVQSGVWPATRVDLFQKACMRLLGEVNREHIDGRIGHVPSDRLFTAAGYLSTIHLCGGTKGLALTPLDADEGFPFIGEIGGVQEALSSAVRRRVFRADGPGRVTPVHRTIAEYLSAHFLTQLLRDGFPLKRMLALLTGYDGGTLAEMRGIYAWLACLCEEEAATLIRHDPLGLVLYGDASILSTSGKRKLIDCLRDLAIKNPGFRSENWSAEPFGALASPDMAPTFKSLLNDKTEPPHLLGCILDAIEHGVPLPDLGNDLIKIVRDNARSEGAQVCALEAFRHVCPNDMGSLRILLDDIQEGHVRDEHHRLRGHLLRTLYPETIKPTEIGRYLVQPEELHVNSYTMFIAHDLVRLTSPQDLPLLITGMDARKIAGSPHHLTWEDFFGRLILQILQHHGETAPSAQLYDWLGKGLDQYDQPVADREEAAAIKTWLESHPAVVQGLFRHWFSVTPFDKPGVEVIYFWRRLHTIAPPKGFHRWLLSQAEREPDPARAAFLFQEGVQGSTVHQREDCPTLEELSSFTERNPLFRRYLESDLCCDIPTWRHKDAERRKDKQRKEKAAREIRIQQLSEQLDVIRSGQLSNALVYLANLYFGRFYDVAQDTSPIDRLTEWTTSEITEVALEGFAACLRAPDIPTPSMIGESETEGSQFNFTFPVLAGMDLLANRSMTEVLSLPNSTLQSALAFHYASLANQERDWVNHLVTSAPDLAAESLMSYWRPHFAKTSRHILGLYGLAHEDVMKSVAQRVSITLLKDYPNAQEENLELLLHAALRHGDHGELLSISKDVAVHHTPLTDENRALWYAVTFALEHERIICELAEHTKGKAELAARVLNFLCPSRGAKSDTPYPLSIAALASLITVMGSIFPPRNISGIGWRAIHGSEGAADTVRSLIRRLGKELTHEATLALSKLQDNPDLAEWVDEIAYVRANQARQRREHAFQYPSVTQVVETLNQGRPANAADLQALVNSHLHSISEELRNGPTDGWKGMWNVDSYGKQIDPRPENDCRDRLLELLRPRLFRAGVAAEPEGHYTDDKRADIKAIMGSINLPIEIKRHFHEDLWTAPLTQLNKLYARDPGTAGRGIYLVFWFGIGAGSIRTRPTEVAEIQTPVQLEAALLETLPPSERELLNIIVIDCAPRSAARQQTVKKPRKRRRGGSGETLSF